MTSCSSSSSRPGCALLGALLAALLCGCAALRPPPPTAAAPRGPRLALLPPINLAGRQVPLPEVRDALEDELRRQGVNLIPRVELEGFLERHRVRFMGGISGEVAAAARAELGLDGIVLASIDLYAKDSLPALAATLRLVAADDPPVIRWVGKLSRTGDEAPGAFETGVLTKLPDVQAVVFSGLGQALLAHLHKQPAAARCGPERRFRPSASFVAPHFDPARRYTVAVLPFVNETTRRSAGELVASDFIRALHDRPTFAVVEPGVVREELIRYRIVSEGGITLDTARLVLEVSGADLVVTGTVRRYEDGIGGTPRVEFTAFALERANSEVVWQTSSYANGDDGVVAFELGRIHTAQELSCRLVGSAVAQALAPAPAP